MIDGRLTCDDCTEDLASGAVRYVRSRPVRLDARVRNASLARSILKLIDVDGIRSDERDVELYDVHVRSLLPAFRRRRSLFVTTRSRSEAISLRLSRTTKSGGDDPYFTSPMCFEPPFVRCYSAIFCFTVRAPPFTACASRSVMSLIGRSSIFAVGCLASMDCSGFFSWSDIVVPRRREVKLPNAKIHHSVVGSSGRVKSLPLGRVPNLFSGGTSSTVGVWHRLARSKS
jgi:hypothetical protein